MGIKVVVADDHAIVRHGLIRLIQNEDDMEVVAQAENGLSAVEIIREYLPDIVVMDISMPQASRVKDLHSKSCFLQLIKIKYILIVVMVLFL